MKKLRTYREKRSRAPMNEPFGDEGGQDERAPESARTLEGAFVVHQHDATRMHFDLRIEVSGVLKSFAVPHGPSLDPEQKALAVMTEDHPIEYLDFEDVIPEGQYGAGAMIAWDRGSVRYLEGPAEEEIPRGKIDMELRGMKLRGRFALVKLKARASEGRENKGNEWLLFKKKDEHAWADGAPRVTDELPRSVFSGLTVEALDRRDAVAEDFLAEAKALAAAKVKPSPREVLFDPELDGVRVRAAREGDAVTLTLLEPRDAPANGEAAAGEPARVEAFYPEVVRALRTLPVTRLVVEGELVAFDASGRPDRARLAARAERLARGDAAGATRTAPVVLVASDLLRLGDVELAPARLDARRALLGRMLPPVGFLRAAPGLEGDEAAVLASARALGLPGVRERRKDGRGEPRTRPTGLATSTTQVPHGNIRDARRVTLTNPQKVFWPEDGLTKRDLFEYYGAVADVMLPYLARRPVILVRYPDGIEGKSFYQWNVPVGMPAWVRTMELPEDDDGKARRGFLVDDRATLLYLANLACIPMHLLAWRVPKPEQADFFTLDLDVKQSELRHAIPLMHTIRELLDAIGLPGFPKTSGQSGLHVLVPLGPGQTFEVAMALADLLGRLVVERHPETATMERIVKKRGARVYVDTGQTGPSRAIVAPYSVRATPGAGVSTPLSWDEVDEDLDPAGFTLKTVPARVARHGDLMAGMMTATPDVARAVAELGALVATGTGGGRRNRARTARRG